MCGRWSSRFGLLVSRVKQHPIRRQELIKAVEFADVPCEHRLAVLDPLQIQDRVVQERLLAPGFYVRQARSGPGQMPAVPNAVSEGALKRCAGMSEMIPLISASTRPVRLSRGSSRPNTCVNSARTIPE